MQFILAVFFSTSLALAMPKTENSGPRYEIDAAGRLTCTNCVYAEGIDPRDPDAELRRAAFEASNPLLQRCLDCYVENPENAVIKRDSIKADDIAPVKRCFACYFWSSAGGGGAGFEPDNSNPKSLQQRHIQQEWAVPSKRCFVCYFGGGGSGVGGEFEGVTDGKSH